MTSAGVNGINFDATDGSFHMDGVQPNPGTAQIPQTFDVIVGATNTLDINTLNIDSSVDLHFAHVALQIDGGGDPTKVGQAVEVMQGQTLTDNAGITIVAGSITVDQNGAISGSTIHLEADASYIGNINSSSLTYTSETIDPGQTVAAKIDIEGSITATSTLDVTTNVTITDSIVSNDEILVDALTINSTNQSEITFGALSRVSATSIDATANTTVTATINATNVDAIGSVLAAYTPNIFGTELQVEININNTTTVTVVSGAQLSATSGDITLAALDATTATTTLQLADPPSIPVVGNVLVFSALDSQDNLTRVTAVDVGNLSASSRASTGATPTLNATGDVNLSAASGGAISNSEMSKALGTVEINAGGNNGDSTSVEIDGVKVQAAGLSLTTESATNYVVSGLLSSITIGGETDAEVANSIVNVGADGLVVSTEDDSTLSSTATSPDYDASQATLKGTSGGSDPDASHEAKGTVISVSYTTSLNTYDKNIIAIVTNSSVTSSGVVRVQAVDNVTLSSIAAMSVDAATTGKVAASGGGMFAANDVLGAVSASIEGSTVATTGGTSDIQVLAGDTSTITARAETSALASSQGTAVAAGATIALNVIGWEFSGTGGLLAATVDTLLGSNVANWTDPFPTDVTASGSTANVTAKITDSTISAGGAILLKSLADGTIAATVTNVSQATSSGNGNQNAVAVGGLIGTNRVSRAATAFLSNVAPPAQPANTKLALGAITVDAENNASITSTSTLITSAVAVSTGAKTDFKSTDAPKNANSNTAALKPTTPVNFGQTVLFKSTYDTSNLFGISTPKEVTIKDGDTVEVSPGFTGDGTLDAVYEYVGQNPPSDPIDLETQQYDTDPNWKQVDATNNTVYQFMGPSGTNVNLSNGLVYDSNGNALTMVNQGYFDLGYWRAVPTAELQSSTDDQGHATSGSSSGSAVGGIVVVNEVHGGAYAIVQNSAVSGDALSVLALNNAAINATLNATATSSGSSSFSSTSLAINASIAINEVLGDADAHIVNSGISTATGNVDVVANNTADIEASTMSAVSSSGNNSVAVGVIMATNTIGAGFQNLPQFDGRHHRRRQCARQHAADRDHRLYQEFQRHCRRSAERLGDLDGGDQRDCRQYHARRRPAFGLRPQLQRGRRAERQSDPLHGHRVY